MRFIISHACQLPDALRPFNSGSGLISVPEVVVDQGLHRHVKQVSDILQADSIHVEAPAGFPIPDDLGVRADLPAPNGCNGAVSGETEYFCQIDGRLIQRSCHRPT